jgi:hypothetical protein
MNIAPANLALLNDRLTQLRLRKECLERITVWPSQKRGEMVLNPAARPLWKRHDRPKGRSRANPIEVTGHG